ncbi:MAG: YidC/Oxa1 family membrane protein insertase [Chloroflexi bacterium]|nr:YidC/Oxa1 family membrane protein insertase [Chloroflexota bacterium]
MAETVPVRKFNVRRFLIFAAIAVLLFLFVSGVVSPTGLWNTILLEPMMNFLVLLSKGLLGNFGIAIIVLTIIIRIISYPLMMRQLKSSRAMQDIQPKMKELQKKYAKDKQKLNAEVMKLYKEQGVNPIGCLGPMLIQFPIWIALYQAIIQALAYTPENLLGLSARLYSWPAIQETLPLNNHFLWLDLARGDIIIAILVAASMWVLQKMTTVPSTDPQQQSTQRMMLWIMPLMFGFFAISLPSGLSIYWIASNIISMIMQYRVTGWGTLSKPSLSFLKRGQSQPAEPASTKATYEDKKKAGEDAGRQKQLTSPKESSPGRKEAVKGEATSQQGKVQHGKHRGKRKN